MSKFGVGFGETVEEVGGRGRRAEMPVKLSGRGWTMSLFLAPLLAGFVGVALRLIWLMAIFGAGYRQQADENRIMVVPIKAVRGIIFDRNGQALVANRPVYRLASQCPSWGVQCEKGMEQKLIGRDEALRMMAMGKSGEVAEDVGREYKFGIVTAHVLGYLGEVSAKEVESGKFRPADLVGRTGIEEYYDETLRGKDGAQLLEVDTSGQILREIGKQEPTAGFDLRLTVSLDLQRAAHEALAGKKGALVAQNPENGEILTMASEPSFDPGIFDVWGDPGNARIKEKGLIEALNDEGLPMFNRAVSGLYPPGSTFKIVTAVAGLEGGEISADFRYEDKGFIQLGTAAQTFSNWYFTQYGRTEGIVGISRAIARSTDTFFYRVGELIGVNKLAGWAREFGLGSLTGVDNVGEVSGLVPDPKWKQEVKGESWFLGDTVIMAIGQGNLLTTPLQVNQMTSVAASGGKLCPPHLAADNKKTCQEVAIKPENLDLVIEGMFGACTTGGTAFPFFDWNEKALEGSFPRVACKTGTAEFGDPKNRTHAWFTAFVEREEAEKFGREPITVTVLVEAGGEGSRVAAPVVRKVLAAYFGLQDNYNYSAISGVGE